MGTDSFQPPLCPLLLKQAARRVLCFAHPCPSEGGGGQPGHRSPPALSSPGSTGSCFLWLFLQVLNCVSTAQRWLQTFLPPLTYLQEGQNEGGDRGRGIALQYLACPAAGPIAHQHLPDVFSFVFVPQRSAQRGLDPSFPHALWVTRLFSGRCFAEEEGCQLQKIPTPVHVAVVAQESIP